MHTETGFYADRNDSSIDTEPKAEKVSEGLVYQKKNTGADVNAIIAHASRVSGNDLDFIATLDKENAGTWAVDVKGWNENGTYDMGICQMNSAYYSHKYKDPNWSNPEWQVNECLNLYRGWEKRGILSKRFFAYPNRNEAKKNFELKQV